MAQVEKFDMVILGSGQGGKLLAWHLGRLGKSVAVVERQWVGGSCPAVACLPSKNEIWSARVIETVRNAGEYGAVTGGLAVDMSKVRDRKRAMVDEEVAAHLAAYEASGAQLIMGEGRFTSSRTIEVALNNGGKRTVCGEQAVVNVGTHAAIPNIPGLAAAKPLTHIGSLELDYAPAHLIILGGGYVGIEMAQAYRRFGSRVTIIERGSQLMSREDTDVSESVLGILRAEGIDVLFNASILQVEGLSGFEVNIVVSVGHEEQRIRGTDLLVAAGRIPNTTNIGLETAGIEVTDQGFIKVNERLQTTASGVWAIGEAAGSPQFTHVSVDDFRIVRDNMAGGNRTTINRLIPHTMFTEPPLAHVGLNEREAQKRGIAVRIARLPMSGVLRTLATGEKHGFMKVIVGEDDRILGFTMIGADAGEVMAVLQAAILGNLPFQSLRDAVLSHLTYSEGIGALLANVPTHVAS